MADENEVVVTIEPELPGLETGAESDAAKDLASQFEEMKAQAERDRTARESADRRTREARADAAKAREEADAARGAVAESQLETVTSGLSAAESEATAAEAAIVAATEAGNFNEAAKQQRRMARAEAQAERLREAQSDIEARKTAKPEPEVRRERAPPADDPVEAYIAGRTEPTAAWLRAHKDFITDPRKNAKLTAGHHDAVAEGLAPDSREYFEHVETFIGLRQSETGTDNRTGNGSRPSPKPQRRPSVPAAPVTSSAGGTNGGGAEVRLTRKEADAATDGTLVWNYDDPSGQKRYKKGDALGVQEVARRKLARLKERGIENPNIES